MDYEERACRYEVKMECSSEMYIQALNWVRVNPAAFRVAYPTRWVNNLYFDTFGFDTYNDHIESATERRKLRLRWYGEALERAEGQLELKSRRGRVGWKLVQPVRRVFDLRVCDWSDFQRDLAAYTHQGQDKTFDEMLRISKPLVINRYKRDYYVSADEHVRLTLDYQISTYSQLLTPRPNLSFAQPAHGVMLIEFKCEVPYARQLPDVLAGFPLRVNRHSKYVTALDVMMER